MASTQDPASYTTNVNGYEMWSVPSPDTIAVHQLVAIANGADPHKVFSDGEYHCHHKNGVRWDNRPGNIEVLSSSEHSILHANRRLEERGIRDALSKSNLKRLYWDEGKSYQEIGDEIGVDETTIKDRIRGYGIAWDQNGPNG